jgi:hypothetical protein
MALVVWAHLAVPDNGPSSGATNCALPRLAPVSVKETSPGGDHRYVYGRMLTRTLVTNGSPLISAKDRPTVTARGHREPRPGGARAGERMLGMVLTALAKGELSRLRVARPCCRKAEVSVVLRFAGGLCVVGGRIVRGGGTRHR